jgi:hypothetical protein
MTDPTFLDRLDETTGLASGDGYARILSLWPPEGIWSGMGRQVASSAEERAQRYFPKKSRRLPHAAFATSASYG